MGERRDEKRQAREAKRVEQRRAARDKVAASGTSFGFAGQAKEAALTQQLVEIQRELLTTGQQLLAAQLETNRLLAAQQAPQMAPMGPRYTANGQSRHGQPA